MPSVFCGVPSSRIQEETYQTPLPRARDVPLLRKEFSEARQTGVIVEYTYSVAYPPNGIEDIALLFLFASREPLFEFVFEESLFAFA